MWKNYLAIILGYLIGSINMAYILGRIKGLDIRKKGSHNAGATNAWDVLGKWYGIGTALFDISKGIIAFFIAFFLTNSTFTNISVFAYLAAFAAILGHDFPFYIGRGGRGAATTYGIILFNIALLVLFYELPLLVVGILFSLILMLLFITKTSNFIFFLFAIISSYIIYHCVGLNIVSISTLVFLAYIFIVSVINLIQIHGLKRELRYMNKKVKVKYSRKILRILAITFPLLYFFFSKNIVFYVLVPIFLFFIVIDIIRILMPKILKKKIIQKIFKKKEKKRISNISLFLISIFLTVLLFPKNIAIIAVLFLIFGDTAAEIFGLKFGRIKIFNKTLEGSLASLAICFSIGILLMNLLNFSLLEIIIVSFAATIIELIPLKIGKFKIDDNFSIGLFTALILYLISLL